VLLWKRIRGLGTTPSRTGIGASALPSPQGSSNSSTKESGGECIYSRLQDRFVARPDQWIERVLSDPVAQAKSCCLYSVNEIILLNPDGTVAGTVSDPTVTATSLYGGRATGAIVIGEVG